MTMRDEQTVPSLLAAFDEHLRRRRGLCPGARRYYVAHVRAFLMRVGAGQRMDVSVITVADIVDHVAGLIGRYRPATVELAATALRSFFRFLRVEGLRSDRLENAVPVVPHRRASLPRHLDGQTFARLIAGLDASTPRGQRDRAIILLMARLGLRSSEITALTLEDIDWRGAMIQVRARKTGHGALLPLPHDVGEAMVDTPQIRRGCDCLPSVEVPDNVSESRKDHAWGAAGRWSPEDRSTGYRPIIAFFCGRPGLAQGDVGLVRRRILRTVRSSRTR